MQKKMLTGYSAQSTLAQVRRTSGHTASTDHVDQPDVEAGHGREEVAVGADGRGGRLAVGRRGGRVTWGPKLK